MVDADDWGAEVTAEEAEAAEMAEGATPASQALLVSSKFGKVWAKGSKNLSERDVALDHS